MAPKMPTLGPEPKKSPMPKVIAIALLAGGIAGGIFWWRGRPASPEAAETTAKAEPPSEALLRAEAMLAEENGSAPGANGAAAQPSTPTTDAAPGTSPATGAPAGSAPSANATGAAAAGSAGAPGASAELLAKSGLKLASATITGPLESAVVAATNSEVGPALTQVVTRTLVWWVQVPNDLLRGDKLAVLYEERPGQEPLVHAVRFDSAKTGKSHRAYLYRSSAEKYPKYYEETGAELELRLKDTPIDEYEQITSLLRDGRRHKGVDFKAPEGTPVKATFDGTITRRNWGFRVNGNSLEIADGRGRKALYLHLSEVPAAMRPGVRVRRGQVIGTSGNTGRSFAPHLHYQLMSGTTKVLDPFDVHGTWRQHLAEAERTAFDAEVRRFDSILSSSLAAN